MRQIFEVANVCLNNFWMRAIDNRTSTNQTELEPRPPRVNFSGFSSIHQGPLNGYVGDRLIFQLFKILIMIYVYFLGAKLDDLNEFLSSSRSCGLNHIVLQPRSNLSLLDHRSRKFIMLSMIFHRGTISWPIYLQ